LVSIAGFHVMLSCDVVQNPSEVSVSSDIKPSQNLAFYNILAQQGSSFCNTAHLNFQAFAFRDIKMAAREGCRVRASNSFLSSEYFKENGHQAK